MAAPMAAPMAALLCRGQRRADRRHGWRTRGAKAEQKANPASAAKSRCLTNMNHEIQTPMNDLLAMAGLLLGEPLPAQPRERVRINRSGRALLAAPDHQSSDQLDERGGHYLDGRIAFKPADLANTELLGRPMTSKTRCPT